MFKDKNNANQILRIDSGRRSGGVFVEVLNSSFPIRKVQMNFIEYDGTNKVKTRISIYVDIETFMELAMEVNTGAFLQKFIAAKQSGMYQGKQIQQYTPYFVDYGGTMSGGEAISRIFQIQEGRNPGTWNLYAAECPGKKNKYGLIQAAGSPTKFLNVPLSHAKLMMLCQKVLMHLQAYTNMIYNEFGNKMFMQVFDEGYTTYFYENRDKNNQNQHQQNRQPQGGNYPPQQNTNMNQGQPTPPQGGNFGNPNQFF